MFFNLPPPNLVFPVLEYRFSSSLSDATLANLAYSLIRHMNVDKVHPSVYTLNSVLEICQSLKDISIAKDTLLLITGSDYGLSNIEPQQHNTPIGRPNRGWVTPNADSLVSLLNIISTSSLFESKDESDIGTHKEISAVIARTSCHRF